MIRRLFTDPPPRTLLILVTWGIALAGVGVLILGITAARNQPAFKDDPCQPLILTELPLEPLLVRQCPPNTVRSVLAFWEAGGMASAYYDHDQRVWRPDIPGLHRLKLELPQPAVWIEFP